jgi:hypothetical protein
MVLLMAACYQSRIAMLMIPPETPWTTIRERIATLHERIRPQAGFIEPNGEEEALDHDVTLFKKTMPRRHSHGNPVGSAYIYLLCDG